MIAFLHRCLAFLFALAAPLPPGVSAQSVPDSTSVSQEQRDSLLAPIALCPDQLLAQVLRASTYPLDVVAEARTTTSSRAP